MGFSSKLSTSTNKQSSETTIISSTANLNGVFYFDSLLHIHGKVSGCINSNNIVVICKTGIVNGEITAKKVVLNGVFEGNINCESMEILGGGIFKGEVTYNQLSIEKEAFFEGQSIIKRKDTRKLIKIENKEE